MQRPTKTHLSALAAATLMLLATGCGGDDSADKEKTSTTTAVVSDESDVADDVETPPADSEAQENLEAALAGAKSQLAEYGGYGLVTPEALSELEPRFTYVAGPSTAVGQVSVATSSEPDSVVLATLSESGTCFVLRDSLFEVPSTTYSEGSCDASAIDGIVFAPSW